MSDVSFWANGHFRVEPCISCPIVGYLIVSPQAPVSSLSELSSSAQALLGPTLAASTRAIETVVQPERVYCLLFAEETRSVHFHLFPRTKWLLSEYTLSHPDVYQVSGPRLLDWARDRFRSSISAEYHQIMQRIFREIDRNI
jgi:diadenosine tetraphosphate (Ap4A) HIT family hydrolase